MEQDAFQGRRPPLPLDVENCHRVIWEMFGALLASRAETERERAEKLEMIRRFFGPRRERFVDDPAQGKLFESGGPAEVEAQEPPSPPVVEEEPPAASSKKRRHGRRRFPSHFPRVRREYKLTDAERLCPCCGKLRKIIGEEISEQLDYVPGHHQVIEHVRFKYACEDCEEHVAIAAKPPQAIEKGAAAAGLLAHIGTSKFGDHLPTYRQEEISDRHGWLIPRTTQCGWLRQMSGTLTLLVALMAAGVLRSRKINTDDTRVPVIIPGEARTKTGYFWVYCGDDQHRYSVYDFTLSHCRDGPAWWLRGYHGYLQADAYGGYDGIAIESEGRLILVGCGAHLRRRFFAQRTLAPEVACAALAWFRQLYQWERKWKDISDDERYALRQQHAMPLLAEFHHWLVKTEPDVLPKSKIGEAVSYALNQWEPWTRYCDAGFLSIDNNLAEQTVKPCAMGRKAWLFLGSQEGGATAATLYSLTGSAKRNRVHPFFYLRDVLERLPAIVHDPRLLPLLKETCRTAPLTEEQRTRLPGCERPGQYLDILRCHTRSLADVFLRNELEQDMLAALSDLLPDRWIVAHPEHRLEINRPTGPPVGLEAALSAAEA
jgi:transposase